MKNYIASDLLVNLFKILEERKIDYMVLRNYEKLPYDNSSKDVDILIHHTESLKVEKIVRDTANNLGYKCIWYNPLDYLIGLVFINIKNEEFYSVKIDLFKGFKWRGLDYLDPNLIFMNSDSYNNFKVPKKHVEALIMLTYYILYAKNINKKYIPLIYENIKSNKDLFEKLLNQHMPKTISEKISQLAMNNKILKIVELRQDIIKCIIIKNFKFETLLNFIKHVNCEIYTRKNFGTTIYIKNDINNISEKLSEIFRSLGITKPIESLPNIKTHLNHNNIVFISENNNKLKSKNKITITNIDTEKECINEIFTKLEQRYTK